MIEIGKISELKVIQKASTGFILGNEEQQVLLPFDAGQPQVLVDDMLSVFVYMNSDGRLMATTKTPYACVDEFAVLEVIDLNDQGAFLDIGIQKDVFVSLKEQKRPMKIGERYVVYLYLNEYNNRIEASTRLSAFVKEDELDFEVGDEVELYITDPSDLGYTAIINKKYHGLLYHNELFEHIKRCRRTRCSLPRKESQQCKNL